MFDATPIEHSLGCKQLLAANLARLEVLFL